MIKKTIQTIHDLKIFFLAIIIVSFLYNLGLDPIDLAKYIGAKFTSAIGVTNSASVAPNPINTLASQLKNKELALAQKEYALQEKEQAMQKSISLQNRLIVFLSIGIIALFILIILNYYLDYQRKKRETELLEQINSTNEVEKNNEN